MSELTSREREDPLETVNDKYDPSSRFFYQASAEWSLLSGPIFSHTERWYRSIHGRLSHDLTKVPTMRCTFHPETPWLTENLQVPGLSRFPIQECCSVNNKVPKFNPKNPSIWQGWEKPWKLTLNSFRNYRFIFLVLKQIQWQRAFNASSMFVRIHLFNANSANSRESYSTLP